MALTFILEAGKRSQNPQLSFLLPTKLEVGEEGLGKRLHMCQTIHVEHGRDIVI